MDNKNFCVNFDIKDDLQMEGIV